MLIVCDRNARQYVIALNNMSNSAELASDFSYLEGAPAGVLTFDFTHMAAGLTQEAREAYLPGSFGFQPTISLLEIVSTIASFTERAAICPHHLAVILPNKHSRVGRFLIDMGLPTLLKKMKLDIGEANPASVELGRDDPTRKSLIPLTVIDTLFGGQPNFEIYELLLESVENVFTEALPGEQSLVNCFTSIVDEAIDNLVEYGRGGIIGGLYYPKIGEVEITMVNRYGGFGGSTPDEELEALIEACEGKTRRAKGGGTGITNLSRLAIVCFGTLLLRNGNAALRLLPDGSVSATTENTGIPTPGAYVTILLQLLPSKYITRTEDMRKFEAVLGRWLQTYSRRSSIRTLQ